MCMKDKEISSTKSNCEKIFGKTSKIGQNANIVDSFVFNENFSKGTMLLVYMFKMQIPE